jgi:hypothetical protein
MAMEVRDDGRTLVRRDLGEDGTFIYAACR